MHHLAADNARWLGAAGTGANSGCGPDQPGGYPVRRFGAAPTLAGRLGLVVAAEGGCDPHARNPMSTWRGAQP
jgi:hypothetical protein